MAGSGVLARVAVGSGVFFSAVLLVSDPGQGFRGAMAGLLMRVTPILPVAADILPFFLCGTAANLALG